MKASLHHKRVVRVGSDGRGESPERKPGWKSEQASFGDINESSSGNSIKYQSSNRYSDV